MRVVYLSEGYRTHDHHFLEALSAKFDTYLLKLTDKGGTGWVELGVRELVPGQRPSSLAPNDLARAIPALRDALSQVKPDAIVAGPIQTCGLCAVLAEVAPAAVVSWGSDLLVDAETTQAMQKATRMAMGKCSLFVCDCDAVRQKATNYLSPDTPIAQFPWGTDLERFHPRGNPLLQGNDTFTFLHTRSFEPIYNVETVIYGFLEAARTDTRLRLDMAGTGSMHAEMRNLADRLGISPKIRFLGLVDHDELPNVFRRSDAYLSASLSDGSSVSLLEAMASGLPVTVSDIPGNREWVKEGVNGFLFSVDDPAALAKAILATASLTSEQRAEMSLTNRSKIEKQANWKVNVGRLTKALMRFRKIN